MVFITHRDAYCVKIGVNRFSIKKQTRGHLFGQCPTLRTEYKRLCVQANKNLVKNGKKERYRWLPWMFFKEEGLERAVIEYVRATGVGFQVNVGFQEEE